MATKTIIETTMKVGSNPVENMYVVSSLVKAVYKGSTRIFDRATYTLTSSNKTDISAAGITFTPTVTSTKTHGDTGTENVSWTLTSVTGTGASKSGNNMVIAANTSASSRSGTFTLTQSSSNLSETYTWTQSSDTISSYGNPVVTLSTTRDIPASGTTVNGLPCISISATQTVYYTSGQSSVIDISNSSTKEYMGQYVITSNGYIQYQVNLGTTEKARTQITKMFVTVTANGKSTDSTIAIYQEANVANAYYDSPTMTLSYAIASSSGGTIYPTITTKANGYYTSGSRSTSSATIASSIINASTDAPSSTATFNSSTGALTWTANSSSSQRSCSVSIQCKASSAKDASGNLLIFSRTTTATQERYLNYGTLTVKANIKAESIFTSNANVTFCDYGSTTPRFTVNNNYTTSGTVAGATIISCGAGTYYLNGSWGQNMFYITLSSTDITNLTNGTNVTKTVS